MTRKSTESILNRLNSTQTARQLSMRENHLRNDRPIILSKRGLDRELDEPWIGARGYNSPEVARLKDSAGALIEATARRIDSIQVADGIGKIRMIEQIKKFRSERDRARLAEMEALHYGEIHIRLLGPYEAVSGYIADVGARFGGSCGAA